MSRPNDPKRGFVVASGQRAGERGDVHPEGTALGVVSTGHKRAATAP